jgi:phage tail-like protein
VDELLQAFRFRVTLTRSAAEPPRSQQGARRAAAAPEGTAPQLLGNGGFQECTGLELEADVREYQEGGRNDGVIRRVGRVKLQPLVLKRGMLTTDPTSPNAHGPVLRELWDWIQGMVAGELPIPRYDGLIEVLDPGNRAPPGTPDPRPPMAVWTFVRGLPMKVTGPSLNARSGEIAIEELHIAHEGLRLVPP